MPRKGEGIGPISYGRLIVSSLAGIILHATD